MTKNLDKILGGKTQFLCGVVEFDYLRDRMLRRICCSWWSICVNCAVDVCIIVAISGYYVVSVWVCIVVVFRGHIPILRLDVYKFVWTCHIFFDLLFYPMYRNVFHFFLIFFVIFGYIFSPFVLIFLFLF